MAALPNRHVAALAVVDRLLRDARGPWWVIAGAAVALHARQPVVVGDVDILLSDEDVPLVAAMSGVSQRQGDGDLLFRSRYYAGAVVSGVAIEFMADFMIRGATGWSPVRPRSRMFVPIGGLSIPTPERAELVEMLVAFGRPKDLERVSLLKG